MLNTAGAVVGWFVAGPLVAVLPHLDPAAERRRYGARVTFGRRLVALLVDVLVSVACLALLQGITTLGAGREAGSASTPYSGIVVGVAWFVVLPRVLGTTVGKRAVRLRVRAEDGGPAGRRALVVRETILLSPLWLSWVAAALDGLDVDLGTVPGLVLLAVAAASFIVVGLWSPLAVLLRRDGRAPYERWSGTVNVAVPVDTTVAPGAPPTDGGAPGRPLSGGPPSMEGGPGGRGAAPRVAVTDPRLKAVGGPPRGRSSRRPGRP